MSKEEIGQYGHYKPDEWKCPNCGAKLCYYENCHNCGPACRECQERPFMTNRTMWDEQVKALVAKMRTTAEVYEDAELLSDLCELEALLPQSEPPAKSGDVERAKSFLCQGGPFDMASAREEIVLLARLLATARREALEQAAEKGREFLLNYEHVSLASMLYVAIMGLDNKAEEPSRSVQKRLAAQKAEPK